jgi:hypothetical protein
MVIFNYYNSLKYSNCIHPIGCNWTNPLYKGLIHFFKKLNEPVVVMWNGL